MNYPPTNAIWSKSWYWTHQVIVLKKLFLSQNKDFKKMMTVSVLPKMIPRKDHSCHFFQNNLGDGQKEVILQTKTAMFIENLMPGACHITLESIFKLFPLILFFDCCMFTISKAVIESGGDSASGTLDCGLSWPHVVTGWKPLFRHEYMPCTPILSHIYFPTHDNDLAQPNNLSALLQKKVTTNLIRFLGEVKLWWNEKQKYFLLGWYAWSNLYLSGSNNKNALNGCFVLINPSNLVMNTTIHT